jgi:HAD superfamily hydrolase (TIGR01490 family)
MASIIEQGIVPGGPVAKGARIAFFDVDGTLTTCPTMFRFLRFYLASLGRPPHEYDERRRTLREMTERGCSREESNRAYFAGLAGADAATVAHCAEEWYRTELDTGGLYHEPVLAALRRHRKDGDHVVLVSGSLPACLHLIAADLGVDDVWCAELEIVRSRYTGALTTPPMIGVAKAAAVKRVIARRRTTRAACVAYGDHVSDLPMLAATGSAVVDGDRSMRAAARANGWRLLPATPPPPELTLPPRRAEQGGTSPVPVLRETRENA